MKQVLNQKRKISFKDFLTFSLWCIGHYFLIFFYCALVYLFHYFIIGGTNFKFVGESKRMLYAIYVSPFISFLMHLWFAERGNAWGRICMWIITTGSLILMITAQFA